ncbi:MAG: phage tail sheath family protein [Acidimicrobiales bacterium]
MTMYSAPGVYVEEVPGGARPIGAVGTSTAAFLGQAPDASAPEGRPVPVNSWTQFIHTFAPEATEGNALSNAVHGFFENGGGRCYVVHVPEGTPLAGSPRQRTGLRALEALDAVAIVAAPGHTGPDAWEALLGHCEKLEDRVAVLDVEATVDDVEELTRVARAGAPKASGRGKAAKSDEADSEGGGSDEGGSGSSSTGGSDAAGGLRPRQSAYGACYFPHLVVQDPLSGSRMATPPSGHLAGVWARTDMSRGVHKAPANEPVRGATDLTYSITREEQSLLNPAGINCVRFFPGEGILVWGARTLDAEASEWRYLPVRRLFNMLKESIGNGTRWIVFEPNDYILWRSIRRDISAFLTRVWRDGALFGRRPEEAFFVKCDEETNPPEVRDAGQVVAVIGVAPVKPAEFVVFKLSQWSGGAEIEQIGG